MVVESVCLHVRDRYGVVHSAFPYANERKKLPEDYMRGYVWADCMRASEHGWVYTYAGDAPVTCLECLGSDFFSNRFMGG